MNYTPSLHDQIMVTGAGGFLGQWVISKLLQRGYDNVTGVIHKVGNGLHHKFPKVNKWVLCDLLRDKQGSVPYKTGINKLISKHKPEVVIHLAATVGGIGANKKNPGKYIYENLKMGVDLIDRVRRSKHVQKFVMVGTVCSYPKFAPVPFKEEDLWNGYPEETNAPYGIAKKTLMELIKAYHAQYQFNGVNLIPVNLYGPGDNFDPQSSHVIPALIRKFEEATLKRSSMVEVWGTGKASREFLHVEDAAKGIILAMENHNEPEPVNLGTGNEITIRDLAFKIREEFQYKGEVIFCDQYPDGQPRRCLDTTQALKKFGWEAKKDFGEGLSETITWWVNHSRRVQNA